MKRHTPVWRFLFEWYIKPVEILFFCARIKTILLLISYIIKNRAFNPVLKLNRKVTNMKRFALYIILFSYSMVMLKPVSPYISDAVAHIFYYSQHMATVHYENGQLHVHREVMDNAKEEQSQKGIPSSKKENTTNDHTGMQEKGSVVILQLDPPFQTTVSSALQYNYLAGEYPPPRA